MSAEPVDRCTRYKPQTKCPGRHAAQASGEFFYSVAHRGWIWGEGGMVSQLMRDEHKAPYTWPFCPWCQGALPDLLDALNGVIWVDAPPDGGEGPE